MLNHLLLCNRKSPIVKYTCMIYYSDDLNSTSAVFSTLLYFDDKLIENVVFEERKLDSKHIVVVAIIDKVIII